MTVQFSCQSQAKRPRIGRQRAQINAGAAQRFGVEGSKRLRWSAEYAVPTNYTPPAPADHRRSCPQPGLEVGPPPFERGLPERWVAEKSRAVNQLVIAEPRRALVSQNSDADSSAKGTYHSVIGFERCLRAWTAAWNKHPDHSSGTRPPTRSSTQ